MFETPEEEAAVAVGFGVFFWILIAFLLLVVVFAYVDY